MIELRRSGVGKDRENRVQSAMCGREQYKTDRLWRVEAIGMAIEEIDGRVYLITTRQSK